MMKGIGRVLLYGSLAALVYAMRPYLFGAPALGPTIVKVDASGNLWVLVDNDLYELSSTGELEKKLSARELHLTKEVIDFDVVPSGEIYVGEARARTISVFDPSGRLKTKLTLPAVNKKTWDVNFKFAVDRRSGELVVSDSDQHRMLMLDSGGVEKKRFGSRGRNKDQFSYPNGISIAAGGRVLIADTRNHRIVIASRDGIVLDSFPSGGDARFPTYVAVAPDGGIAVVNKEERVKFQGGEIVLFEANGAPKKTIHLPKGTDPEGIAFFDDGWIVADVAGWRLLRLSREGEQRGELGGPDFRAALAAYRR